MAISTHDLNLAASICRELILMRDGRVLAAGPTGEVLTPENVSALYDVEADVHVHERHRPHDRRARCGGSSSGERSAAASSRVVAAVRACSRSR